MFSGDDQNPVKVSIGLPSAISIQVHASVKWMKPCSTSHGEMSRDYSTDTPSAFATFNLWLRICSLQWKWEKDGRPAELQHLLQSQKPHRSEAQNWCLWDWLRGVRECCKRKCHSVFLIGGCTPRDWDAIVITWSPCKHWITTGLGRRNPQKPVIPSTAAAPQPKMDKMPQEYEGLRTTYGRTVIK